MKQIILRLLLVVLASATLCGAARWTCPNRRLQPLCRLTGSDQHRILWFRIAKNGTRSIAALLREEIGKDLNLDPTAGHSTRYCKRKYRDYYKFTFVRNPWARAVSCYFNKVIVKNKMFKECQKMSFEEWIDWLACQDLRRVNLHCRPQSYFFPPNVKFDFIGRLENFEEDLCELMSHLGITIDCVPHNNKSDHEHYSHYYNDRTREMVRKIYAEDIARFGYEFEEE